MSGGFVGVDWTTDAERVVFGGLVDAQGLRVTREGNLRTIEGLANGLTLRGDYAVGAIWDTARDYILWFSFDGGFTTLYIDSTSRALGSITNRTTSAFTSGNELVTLAEMNELIFIQPYLENLQYWNGSALAALASADTDLDDDGDSTDPIKFAGISTFGPHLIGFGYGDQTGSGTEQTGDLGADRPEIVRWSHLGNPSKWRPENWIMVGTRGLPVLAVIEAFGRALVLKPEGAYLLFGDLEQNLPQLEPLQKDSGRLNGIVGPHAWCVHDGVPYWMSPSGPMRWTGGPAAEYLGYAVENSLTADYRTETHFVVPVPSWDAVLFCQPESTYGPSFAGVGGTLNSPASETNIWIYDTQNARWAGRTEVASSRPMLNGWVLPSATGETRTVLGSGYTLTDNPDTYVGGTRIVFTTPEVEMADGADAVLKAVRFRGDWLPSDGYFGLTIYVDGTSVATPRIFLRSSSPTANAAGDVWYDTDDKKRYVWDGSAWKERFGIPDEVIEVPLRKVGRTVKVTVDQDNGTTQSKQIIREYGFTARRV